MTSEEPWILALRQIVALVEVGICCVGMARCYISGYRGLPSPGAQGPTEQVQKSHAQSST
jgi:hypothetical protein